MYPDKGVQGVRPLAGLGALEPDCDGVFARLELGDDEPKLAGDVEFPGGAELSDLGEPRIGLRRDFVGNPERHQVDLQRGEKRLRSFAEIEPRKLACLDAALIERRRELCLRGWRHHNRRDH